MRIIIVGCGKVGSELAGQLSAAGHNLTLIDLSERRLDELSNTYDLATVKGSGTSYHVLREAGVQDTDLLIAVTTHDEINLLSCLIARKASGCHAIARVRDPEYVSDLGFIRDELGISMVINPELSTARVVSRLIRFPSAIRVSTFARGRIELLDLKIPHESRLDGMAVCEVNPLLRTDVLRCAVAVSAEFRMLQKTVFRNLLFKLLTGQEKVMDTVLFSFPGLACRGRNGKIHILLSAYLCQNRALAYAGRTGDNKQNTFFIHLDSPHFPFRGFPYVPKWFPA